MAAAGRRQGAHLKGLKGLRELLLTEPYRFEFFQAVRLLERMAREDGSRGESELRPVGHDFSPAEEVVRFRSAQSLSFPAADVASLSAEDSGPSGDGARLSMAVSFLGLTGSAGVLPDHYTSLVLERLRDKDTALRDFLDVFGHRLISLFYRAHEKYRFPAAWERTRLRTGGSRATAGKNGDLFTRCLFSLVGLGTEGLRKRLRIDDRVLLAYAGLFADRRRPAVSLERLIADYLGLPARVEQFRGHWLQLSESDRTSLPDRDRPQGRNARLGTSAVLGSSVWDVQLTFRVRLGPLTLEQLEGLLPSGDMLEPLRDLVLWFAGPELDFDFQLVLRGGETPFCRLGTADGGGSRLGWTTWLRARSRDVEVEGPVFSSGTLSEDA